MHKNARGIYHGTAAQEDDYVIHKQGGTYHPGSAKYYVDRIGRGGTHVTIGTTRGFPSVVEAVEGIRKDAHTKGIRAGVIFEQRGDELAQIGHTDARHEANGHEESLSFDLQDYGAQMNQWNAGQGDPIYAVGSYAYSGKIHPDREMIESALNELERLEHRERSRSNKEELQTLIDQTNEILSLEQTPNARRKGKGPAGGGKGKPGKRLAWVYGKDDSNLLVFVTEEPDGLFYTWTRQGLDGPQDWTYGFGSLEEAKAEMYRLGGYSGPPRGWEEGLERNAREEPDVQAARELSLYIENEYDLVGAPNSQGKAIEKNLLRKIKNGSFDLALSEKAWMYLMETGAKKYAKEYASPGDWSKMFNKPTRELVAHEFAVTFYEENKGS